MSSDLKALRDIFDAGVVAVNGKNAVTRALRDELPIKIYMVAVGKAAASMATGAMEVIGNNLAAGLLISKYGHIEDDLKQHPELQCIESAHPVPDENSLLAGVQLQKFVAQVPVDATLLVLTSGGTSSLVEVLPPGMTLQDLQRVNQFLLSAGLDINVMNVIRKSLSGIKGGRLASYVNCKRTLQLLISDVPGDALHSIGSGPLVPPADKAEDAALLATVPGGLPDWLIALQGQNKPPPDRDATLWRSIESVIVASNKIACSASVEQSLRCGMGVRLEAGELTGDVIDMAAEVVRHLHDQDFQPGVYIWGGETTVQLPDSPGRGGRNQQLALQLSVDLAADLAASAPSVKWQVLVCGTDGSDGPTQDAGGILDSSTLASGQILGFDAHDHIRRADAGSYLAATNALVTTGPTGTNVMDLAIVILL